MFTTKAALKAYATRTSECDDGCHWKVLTARLNAATPKTQRHFPTQKKNELYPNSMLVHVTSTLKLCNNGLFFGTFLDHSSAPKRQHYWQNDDGHHPGPDQKTRRLFFLMFVLEDWLVAPLLVLGQWFLVLTYNLKYMFIFCPLKAPSVSFHTKKSHNFW